MTTWEPDVCMYHHPCKDGFTAAWIVARRFPQVELIGVNHGDQIDEMGWVWQDRNVLIVDFSFNADGLATVVEQGAKSIIVLDHHKTAQVDLAIHAPVVVISSLNLLNAPDVFKCQHPARTVAWFDMNKSGARLAWEFCHPDVVAPHLVELVEDRDLWLGRYPDSRAVSMLLESHDFDLDEWDKLNLKLRSPLSMTSGALVEARAIERYVDRRLSDIAGRAIIRRVGDHHGVPTIKSTGGDASDLGHLLLKMYPRAPFAAVVFEWDGEATWSLRSEAHRVDVSEVARRYGGGGHRNAAGFRVPT